MKKFLLVSFSLALALSALAQERIISGKVTAQEDGLPLPGVNVVLKGTTQGSVTDSKGEYKFTVPATGGTLIFSFIGLATRIALASPFISATVLSQIIRKNSRSK